jgi:L-threonate 2-dehydrogenase
MKSVGIIGVGNMGGGMARRLLSQGWAVHVRDVDATVLSPLQALGAVVHPTPAALAQAADRLIVCVVDAQQMDEVLFGAQGAANSLRLGQAVLLCPTISPEDAESLGQRLSALGAEPIDAPMSGGPVRAEQGTMSLMVACPDSVFEAHQDVLHALANPVFRISERVGDGARTKLVNNLLAGINLAGAAEVLALAERMGLSQATTLNVMERSSGQSWIASDRMRRAIDGDYAPRAHMTLLEKDTRLAVEAAQRVGVKPALGTQASAIFAQASAAGFAKDDDAALLKHLTTP